MTFWPRRRAAVRVTPAEVLDSRAARAELRAVLDDLKRITARIEQLVEDDT